MATANAEVQRMFAGLFAQFEKENRQRQYKAAKADPDKHRLTRVMEGHTGYTYWPAGERKLKTKLYRTRICVATNRNAAGNFLIWRQVEMFVGKRRKWKQTERFDFKWSNSKRDARECAKRWSKRLIEAQASPAEDALPN